MKKSCSASNEQKEWGFNALLSACSQGNQDIVQKLLQDKTMPINQKDNIGNTVSMRASSNGQKEIVQMLLQETSLEVNKQNVRGKRP